MNYLSIYNRLISRSIGRMLDGYKERHHIIPKCIGGTDNLSNIAILTAEEHFVAHQLLVKIYPNEPKLIFALHKMISGKYRNNKLYSWIRKRHAKEMSNFVRTKEHCINISKAKKGKISHKKGKPVTNDIRLIKIKTPDGIFISYAEAGRYFGINRFTIRARCHSKNYPEWEIM